MNSLALIALSLLLFSTSQAQESLLSKDLSANYLLSKTNNADKNLNLLLKKYSDSNSNLIYDPTILTIAAGVESQESNYKMKDFKNTNLSCSKESSQFYLSDPAAFAKIKKDSDRLVILLNSSFSGKGWISKIMSFYERQSSKTSFLAMKGFLTKKFTQNGAAVAPPLSGKLVAQDLYCRLSEFIEVNNFTHIDIVGLSGGATLALHLASIDSLEEKKTFNRIISLSPVMNWLETSLAVDNEVSSIQAHGSLKKYNEHFFNVKVLASLWFSKLAKSWTNMLAVSSTKKTETKFSTQRIHDLFYNSFIYDDLKRLASYEEQNGFYFSKGTYNLEYYQHTAQRHFELGYINEPKTVRDLSLLSDLRSTINTITTPTVIIHPLDDLVSMTDQASSLDELPSYTVDSLKAAHSNPYINTFTPEYGAHLGYLLDNDWLYKLLK